MSRPMKLGVYDARSFRVDLDESDTRAFYLRRQIRRFPEQRHRADGYWVVPATEPNIVHFRTEFAPELVEVDDDAQVFLEYWERTIELAQAREKRRWKYLFDDPELSVSTFQYPSRCHVRVRDASTGKRDFFPVRKPYHHQAVALDALHNQEFFALFMEMGTGKTKVVCDEIAECIQGRKHYNVLVVCPKTIIGTWRNELAKWLPVELSRHIIRLRTGNNGMEQLIHLIRSDARLRIVLTNYERVGSMLEGLKALEFDLMVCDESTKIKSPSASRSKAAREVGETAHRRIILSGNPVTNGVFDLYSQFEFLQQGVLGYSTYNAFRNRYDSVRKRSDWAGEGGRWGREKLDELKRRVARHSFIVTKDQCLDLPEKVYSVRHVPMGKRQRELYDQMAGWYMAEMQAAVDASDGVVEARAFIAMILRLSQITQGFVKDTQTHGKIVPIPDGDGKLQALMEILEDEVPANQKVVVWARFHYDVDAISAALDKANIPYLTLTGKTPDRERETIEVDFNEGPARVLIGEPGTGGMGLTLIGTEGRPCCTQVFYSNDYSYDKRAQAEDRSHRIGQRNNVTYIDLVCPGSIDEHIAAKLQMKRDISDEVKSMESVRAVLLGNRENLQENGNG